MESARGKSGRLRPNPDLQLLLSIQEIHDNNRKAGNELDCVAYDNWRILELYPIDKPDGAYGKDHQIRPYGDLFYFLCFENFKRL